MLTITIEQLNLLRKLRIIDSRSHGNLFKLATGKTIEELAESVKPGKRPGDETALLVGLDPGESVEIPINGRRMSSIRSVAYRIAADRGFKVSVTSNGNIVTVTRRLEGDEAVAHMDLEDGEGAVVNVPAMARRSASGSGKTVLRERLERMRVGDSIFVPWTLQSGTSCPTGAAHRVGKAKGGKYSANSAVKNGKDGYLITRRK